MIIFEQFFIFIKIEIISSKKFFLNAVSFCLNSLSKYITDAFTKFLNGSIDLFLSVSFKKEFLKSLMADLIDSFDLPDIILQTPDKFNKPEVIFSS